MYPLLKLCGLLSEGFLCCFWIPERFILKTLPSIIIGRTCPRKKPFGGIIWVNEENAWTKRHFKFLFNRNILLYRQFSIIVRIQRGRLKVCSKSIVFDPKEFHFPILKVCPIVEPYDGWKESFSHWGFHTL